MSVNAAFFIIGFVFISMSYFVKVPVASSNVPRGGQGGTATVHGNDSTAIGGDGGGVAPIEEYYP